MTADSAAAIAFRNRYLWLVFPMMFAVVLTANIVLVYFALASWPGLAFENPSERGRKFNQVLQAEEKESGLGWQFSVRYAGDSIVVVLRDASGAPLTDATVSATLARPLGQIADRPLDLRAEAPGIYRAQIVLGAPGQWEVRIAAVRGADRAHNAIRFLAN
jgi:nitrogen fixation protein FixH